MSTFDHFTLSPPPPNHRDGGVGNTLHRHASLPTACGAQTALPMQTDSSRESRCTYHGVREEGAMARFVARWNPGCVQNLTAVQMRSTRPWAPATATLFNTFTTSSSSLAVLSALGNKFANISFLLPAPLYLVRRRVRLTDHLVFCRCVLEPSLPPNRHFWVLSMRGSVVKPSPSDHIVRKHAYAAHWAKSTH